MVAAPTVEKSRVVMFPIPSNDLLLAVKLAASLLSEAVCSADLRFRRRLLRRQAVELVPTESRTESLRRKPAVELCISACGILSACGR